jgi:hypothetical protein
MERLVRSQYRLPEDVDSWLKAVAKRQSRSKNGQLVEFLRGLMRQEENGS